MKSRSPWGPPCVLAAVSLLAFAAGAAGQSSAAGSVPPAAGRPRAQALRRQEGWPKKIRFGDATLSLEAPQATGLDGTKLQAASAGRMESDAGAELSSGTVSFEADVETDRASRTMTLAAVRVQSVDFPKMPSARRERISARVSDALTRMRPTLALDDVLAGVAVARNRGQDASKLNTDPPKILFEAGPAILLVFDGEPRFHAVEGSKLERALNTPFLVLRASGSNAYYLNGGTTWFRAEDPKGPWTETRDVPKEARQIAERDLKEGGVPESELKQASQTADSRVPKILVATEPTELIVSEGAPKWSAVVEGSLETASNSGSDLFRTLPDEQYWIVLSGRWYRSGSLSGPWSFVEPFRLPESFRRIPSDSPKADALAFVPGTTAAREALADASKPRTAAIRRSDAHVTVTYDGEPRFEEIAGTPVEYAVNTPDQVLKMRGRYYVVDQGVWFTAGAPTGPWAVADSIPEDDIQGIPSESPVYNTRYAYIYDSTPEVVYTAYTPAYLGSYPYAGTVVYGTGWAYRPWWGAYYYPRPWTWGFHARYALGAGWGYGFSWGPGWGGWRYGFGYGWGARWCGPGAFFRPAFRNVSITRNVTVNRNLYASGANRARATATRTASTGTRGTNAAAGKNSAAGQRAQGDGHAAAQGKSIQGKRANAPHAGKPAGAHGKPGGAKAPRGGGGRKH
ncbi:MAG: carbohydrate-binding family V/XII [Acidobacteriota bacterium]|nr:carbohydrate-binding family V/XII [Acidobacteriota bacterium]